MARILIVDDNEIDRTILSSMLEPAGHELVFAPNGEEALKRYLRHAIDVVVTDIQMPHGDGLELIEALTGLDPDASVVAISGKDPQNLELAKWQGARSILQKPVDREALLRAVEDAAAPEGPPSPNA